KSDTRYSQGSAHLKDDALSVSQTFADSTAVTNSCGVIIVSGFTKARTVSRLKSVVSFVSRYAALLFIAAANIGASFGFITCAYALISAAVGSSTITNRA